jgi:predicted O-methyltransferase YrrM
VSKISTGFAILKELARSPSSLGRVVYSDAGDAMRRYVEESYGLAAGLPQIDLLSLMPTPEETIYPYSFLEGQATVPDLVLLKSLARRRADCRFLEIGTWRGESLASVASVADVCVSISLSPDEMSVMGLSREFIEAHGFFTHDLDNVSYVSENSHTFDFRSLNQTFDLIFVDGDHSRDGIANDTREVFNLLRDDESVIVWHDYSHTPEMVRWEVLAGILDGCPASERDRLYHVSNTMCAIYTRDHVLHRYARRFEPPRAIFDVRVRAQDAGESVLTAGRDVKRQVDLP